MFNFQVRNRQNVAASTRSNDPASPSVGEIDTKAPFESVKAALNLFVEASPKADRPVLKKSRTMEESVLGKETQLHWILKQIDKYKEHVKTAESTKGQALGELDKANNTLQDLSRRLEAASESKQSSIQATEAANTQLDQLKSAPAWQETLDNERNLYKAAANQLISTKQNLNNLKQDFDIALEAKQVSFQRAAEAQHTAKLNRKKISQLTKDVEAMSQTLERVKIASAKAEEDHEKLMEEKEALLDSKKKAKEEIDLKRAECLTKKEKDPADGNLEKRLEETTEVVNVLREQLKEVREADMEMLRNANEEVAEAKRRLEEMKEEERSVRDLVESLKRELEDVRRDISSSKEDDLKCEELRVELDQIKVEVQQALTKETISATHVNELESKLHEMWSEAEKATEMEQEMKKQVETLWREAQRSELAIKDSEAKLEIAQRQVEEAKAAKELADDQIRKQSSKKKEESGVIDSNNITLTTQDFEALSRKAEEATSAADTKVATIKAELETIKEKERGVLEKLEKGMQENKEIQEEISNAQSTVDAARKTVENELNKWRQETKS